MSVKLDIVEDPAATCATMMADVGRAGGHIVLAGGSTPKRAYELAAELGDAFTGASLWFGDDRCVAPDDERSNYRMFKEALLDRVAPGISIPGVHRIRGELGPEAAADAYEQEHGSRCRPHQW